MQVIITKNALTSTIIVTSVTNNNNSDPRKTDKSNSGHRSQETPRLH